MLEFPRGRAGLVVPKLGCDTVEQSVQLFGTNQGVIKAVAERMDDVTG